MSTRRSKVAWLLAGSLALAAVPIARAETPFEKGQAAYQAGNYTEAYALFQIVFEQTPAFDAAANLGQTALKLGKKEAAAMYLQYAIQTLPVSIKPETRDALTKLHGEAKAGLVEVRWKVTGDAELKVDGITVGKSPPLTVTYAKPGLHRFEATFSDGRFADKQLETKENDSITLDLQPPAKPAPSAPPPPPPPPPSASASASASAEPPPPPQKSGFDAVRLPVSIAIGATGGVMFIIGVSLAGASGGRAGDADKLLQDMKSAGAPACPGQPNCTALKQANQDADGLMNAGVPLLVTGLLLGATGATLGLLPSSVFGGSSGNKAAGGPSIRFTPSPGGLVVHGTF